MILYTPGASRQASTTKMDEPIEILTEEVKAASEIACAECCRHDTQEPLSEEDEVPDSLFSICIIL